MVSGLKCIVNAAFEDVPKDVIGGKTNPYHYKKRIVKIKGHPEFILSEMDLQCRLFENMRKRIKNDNKMRISTNCKLSRGPGKPKFDIVIYKKFTGLKFPFRSGIEIEPECIIELKVWHGYTLKNGNGKKRDQAKNDLDRLTEMGANANHRFFIAFDVRNEGNDTYYMQKLFENYRNRVCIRYYNLEASKKIIIKV